MSPRINAKVFNSWVLHTLHTLVLYIYTVNNSPKITKKSGGGGLRRRPTGGDGAVPGVAGRGERRGGVAGIGERRGGGVAGRGEAEAASLEEGNGAVGGER